MPFDKFGLPFLYPSKTTGGLGTGSPLFYQQSNDIRNDNIIDDSGVGGFDNVNTTTGEFTCNYGSSDAWTIKKDPSFSNSIGGCAMNFADSEDRGYAYKADQPRDIELKLLARFIDANADTGFSIKGPTGNHTSSNCCQGFSYMFAIERLNTSPQQFRFRKEMWHVNYDTDPKTGTWTHPAANFSMTGVGRYVGLCYCRYNKPHGRGTGRDSVIVEGWINPDPTTDKNNWIMMKRTEDTGGWGDGGTDCNGEETQVGTWSNAEFAIKGSDMTIQFKNVTLREIDPFSDFDDPVVPPAEPPSGGGGSGGGGSGGGTTTVQGSFKFQQDINTLRSSPCAGVGTGGGGGGGGGGTPTGNAIFWEIPASHDTALSDTVIHEHRTRVVEICKTSSSPFNGKKVIQLDIPLKKVGSPTTPDIRAKIWNSAGTVKYTSDTEIDPATLTTSFQYFTFDFSDNTHVMVPGNRIGVEWTGSSDVNYIEAGYENESTGLASIYANYEGAAGWDEKTTRDFACTAWE